MLPQIRAFGDNYKDVGAQWEFSRLVVFSAYGSQRMAEDDEFVLPVQDDGIGIGPTAPPSGTGLGTRICGALVGQMRGRMQAEPAAPGTNRPGLRWTVRFPASGRAPDQSRGTVSMAAVSRPSNRTT
jgi:hypothetical protein